MPGVVQDIRYAARGLAKTPGFTTVAVLTLGLGIGANTAIFSIVDHVILRPLAYHDPDRLYVVHEFIPKFAHLAPNGVPVVANHFLEWKRSSTAFESMALLSDMTVNLTGSGEPEQIAGARVSADLFQMLGVQPQLGRTFAADEDQQGRDRIVIINDELWRRRFAADPRVIGTKAMLNGEPYEIVGVLPPDFRFPKLADLYPMTMYEKRPLLWKPLGLSDFEQSDIGNFDFNSIVRLKRGATVSRALGEINAAQVSVAKRFPDAIELRARMVPLDEQITGRSRTGLHVLFGAVAVVLLIGCVNLINLLLARSSSRGREIAVRSALGASRGRLMRQMLTESVLLAAIGGATGIVIAQITLSMVMSWAPVDLPRMDEVSIDARVMSFALALSTLTAVLVGVFPARQFARADPQNTMELSSRTTTSGGAAGRFRSVLVGTRSRSRLPASSQVVCSSTASFAWSMSIPDFAANE
jgi:putative ABC transport system permease protein